jgi:hypothetical protein
MNEDQIRDFIYRAITPSARELPFLRMMREREAELERLTHEMRLPAELLGPSEEGAPAYTLRRYAMPIQIPPDHRTPQQKELDAERMAVFAQQMLERIVIRGVYPATISDPPAQPGSGERKEQEHGS